MQSHPQHATPSTSTSTSIPTSTSTPSLPYAHPIQPNITRQRSPPLVSNQPLRSDEYYQHTQRIYGRQADDDDDEVMGSRNALSSTGHPHQPKLTNAQLRMERARERARRRKKIFAIKHLQRKGGQNDSVSSSSHSHHHPSHPRSISVSSNNSDDLADGMPRRHLHATSSSTCCTCALHELSLSGRQRCLYFSVMIQIVAGCVLLGVAIHAVSTFFVSPLLHYTILGSGIFSFITSLILLIASCRLRIILFTIYLTCTALVCIILLIAGVIALEANVLDVASQVKTEWAKYPTDIRQSYGDNVDILIELAQRHLKELGVAAITSTTVMLGLFLLISLFRSLFQSEMMHAYDRVAAHTTYQQRLKQRQEDARRHRQQEEIEMIPQQSYAIDVYDPNQPEPDGPFAADASSLDDTHDTGLHPHNDVHDMITMDDHSHIVHNDSSSLDLTLEQEAELARVPEQVQITSYEYGQAYIYSSHPQQQPYTDSHLDLSTPPPELSQSQSQAAMMTRSPIRNRGQSFNE